MCGIVGVFHNGKAKEQVEQALTLMENRGRDGSGVKEVFSNSFFGHRLHAVVERVPQPLVGEGTLVANCEIYNWKNLAVKYSFPAKNDAELLLQFFDRFGVTDTSLNQLDGVYAFAYFREKKLFLARDILGEKPLWFTVEKNQFAFASEKKVLIALGFQQIKELHPRQLAIHDVASSSSSSSSSSSGTLLFQQRAFFTCIPEHLDSYGLLKEKTTQLLNKAILKRIPRKKFGLLFSGGVDSTFLAKILKEHGYEFTCYTAVLDTENDMVLPSDLIYARKAAQELGLCLKIKKIKQEEIYSYLKKIVPLIEDSNVVKVGVALPFFIASEMAKEDGCKVIFSGLGSEEIFAGYERHKLARNINSECLSGLRKLFERDLYRDDVITMYHNLELRLPFLDRELADFSLKIPQEHKINAEISKKILREIALEHGIPLDIAFRKKTAAQYGSRFATALEKLAKKNNFLSQSAYLKTFYPRPNLQLGVLFSSGKDSATAAYIMQQQNYRLACLITLKPKNQDSYMFQEAGTELVGLQAQAMGLPLVVQETAGEKEKELIDLKAALQEAKSKYGIDGIITGALSSTYQRDRMEQVCEELGLKVFSPLWHKSQENHLQELLNYGFEAVITKIAADGLDERWLGRFLDAQAVKELQLLAKKNGINPAGEGGEVESVVIAGPLFQRKIFLKNTRKVMDGHHSGKLVIEEAVLV
ncbi:diphthine--ammonia ligase [Candidatus Woesearchaeota archaeon]|nr:diphthine--ammonia ligase [Candidatus Woesearchaeota archaeon]